MLSIAIIKQKLYNTSTIAFLEIGVKQMSETKIEPRTLPGFMELLPNEQILFNH